MKFTEHKYQLKTLLVVSLLASLTACGGGGDDDKITSTPANPTIGNCNANTFDEMWLDKRLKCFKVDQKILDTSIYAQDGTSDDYSFTVNQRIYDEKITRPGKC